MSGCEYQHRRRDIRLGLLLSVLVHLCAGLVAAQVTMEGAQTESMRVSATGLLSPVMNLDFEPPPATPESPAIPPPEPPKPELAQATPPEQLSRLKLGIEESEQKTENWMGFKEPTPHSAPVSSVEQPALDPNAGAPGPPAPQVMPTPPAETPPATTEPAARPTPEANPVPAAAEPTPVTPPTPLPMQPVPEQTPPGPEHATGEPMKPTELPAAPEVQPKIEPVAQKPAETLPGASPPDAVKDPMGQDDGAEKPELLPRPAAEFVGPMPRDAEETPDGMREEASRPEKGAEGEERGPMLAAAPPRPTAPQSLSAPAPPTTPAAKTPGAQVSPSAATPPSPMGGNDGARPGEVSDKQADPTALEATIDIRPGRPAAAQGLEITTRRPQFTRLTRVTVYPKNPLLKVTIDRRGRVAKVEILESSGADDVDLPVINAVYQWTAKGKALDDLAADNPEAGITVKIRILLR